MIGQWQNILYFNGSTLQTMEDKVHIVIADLFGGSYNAVFSHLHPNKKSLLPRFQNFGSRVLDQ